MELLPSRDEDDFILASEILKDVVAWLELQGTPLWEPDQVSVEGLSNSYSLDELYFMTENNRLVGLIFLQQSDPFFWPEIVVKDSLYVLKLCFIYSFKGAGLGNIALGLIRRKAKDMGKLWLRLDCNDRPELHAFYKANGFQLVDVIKIEKYTVARYQVEC